MSYNSKLPSMRPTARIFGFSFDAASAETGFGVWIFFIGLLRLLRDQKQTNPGCKLPTEEPENPYPAAIKSGVSYTQGK